MDTKKLLVGNCLWILVLVCCTSSGSSDAQKVLDQALRYHGGLERYRSIQEFSYRKTTILYDSAGGEESRVAQNYFYRFDEPYSGRIEWYEGEEHHIIEYNGDEIRSYINDALQTSPAAIEESRQLISSSQFVLFQPFRLADDDVTLTYDNTKVPFLLGKYAVIRPKFPGQSTDIWKFVMDLNTGKVIANIVTHNERVSFIENLSYDETNGLIMHKHRKSYFLGPGLQKKVLRAEYFYDEYQWKEIGK